VYIVTTAYIKTLVIVLLVVVLVFMC